MKRKKQQRETIDLPKHFLQQAERRRDALAITAMATVLKKDRHQPLTVAERYQLLELQNAQDKVRTMQLLPEELAKNTDDKDPAQFGAAIDRAYARVIKEHETLTSDEEPPPEGERH